MKKFRPETRNLKPETEDSSEPSANSASAGGTEGAEKGGGEELIRCFIAVELDEAVRAALGHEVDRLRRVGAKVSWVRPENMHLTLVFLGEIMAKRLEAVCGIMDGEAGSAAPFRLRVEGTGTFGSVRVPRVVWAGMPDPPASLAALQGGLTERLLGKGFEVDRRAYTPHLTLGRVRGAARAAELTSAIASANNIDFGALSVTRIVLMQSHMEAQGVRYSMVHESGLKGV